MDETNRSCDGGIALITGGGSGIGRATAMAFAREGASVVVADRDLAGAEATCRAIDDSGTNARALAVDVTDDSQIDEMIASTVAAFGRIDYAVNAAGISDTRVPFVERTRDSWDEMIAINLTGVFVCMQAELRQMLRQEPREGWRGSIVNISSGAGRIPAPGRNHYTAAKHGVVGLTRCAAQEHLGDLIRTNAVLPGLTDTPMTEYLKEDAAGRAMIDMMPLGRMATPPELAEAIVWLASGRASWINGQAISVDGGAVMH